MEEEEEEEERKRERERERERERRDGAYLNPVKRNETEREVIERSSRSFF